MHVSVGGGTLSPSHAFAFSLLAAAAAGAMGVPSFFRWVSERYPRVVAPPDPSGCDNLYIDLNGIIHPCFHPEEGPQPTSEDEVFRNILAAIDEIIGVARPRRLVYVAVDGPAPRAKMNQQRSRRYRSAQEAAQKAMLEEQLRERWRRQGKRLPAEASAMDSNVITPGTEFMHRLGRWLRHWAYLHLNGEHSPAYRIVLSDGSVPGEGEHKVMTFIRAQRHAPEHDPNTRHCIHGLDADLIMLGLATHEPHFTILREVRDRRRNRGGRGGGRGGGHGGKFEVVRLSVLREYLQRELGDADWSGVRGGFDLERAIDDFVFLCFFVGNDFLPHMPGLEM